MDSLHIRVALLEAGTTESFGSHKERQIADRRIAAEAALHTAMPHRNEQVAHRRMVNLKCQVNCAGGAVVDHLSFSRL